MLEGFGLSACTGIPSIQKRQHIPLHIWRTSKNALLMCLLLLTCGIAHTNLYVIRCYVKLLQENWNEIDAALKPARKVRLIAN